MTPGGGRGWFHRKRSQPADPPTPETSSAPKPPSRRQSDRRSHQLVWLSRERRSAEPSTQSNAPLEPAVTLARSAAPPQQPGDPFQQRVEPVLSAGEVPQQSPRGPADNEIRTSAGIDWDAETAAALSGDGEAMHHSSGPNALDAHAAPDQLLEDLIREIVGDAAVDTASSLHAPRPIMGTEEPLPPTPAGAESPHSDPGHDALSSEVPGSDLPSVPSSACRAPARRTLTHRSPTCAAPISRAPRVRIGRSRTPRSQACEPLGREVPRQEAPHATVTSASVDEYRPVDIRLPPTTPQQPRTSSPNPPHRPRRRAKMRTHRARVRRRSRSRRRHRCPQRRE